MHLTRMLRRISLEVKSRNDLQAAAKLNGAELSIADCRPFDRNGMVMLLELTGTPKAIEGTLTTIRRMTGVMQAYEVQDDGERTHVLVTLERPGVCRASAGAAILCLECPFDSTEIPAKWRFIASATNDLSQIMTKLGEEGIEARVEDVSPLDQKATLTERERGVLAVAIERGYFDFPRKITLAELSQLVGVSPLALRKILRSAE